MTRLRGIWIVWSDGREAAVAYSRRFSSVETRLKQTQNQAYIPVPNNNALLDHVTTHLRLSSDSMKFIECRDSCDRHNTAPVYSIPLQDKKIFHLVIIQEKNWLFCCAPVLNCEDGDNDHVRCSPAIPMAIAALNGIVQLLQPLPLENALGQSQLHLLDMFLCQAMPFGRPIDVDPLVFQAKLQNKAVSISATSKQPAWKPLLHKGRANISLTITEYVKCFQFGKPDILDEFQCHGSISCLALLEGFLPEISLNITHVDSKKIPAISNLLIHPCVSYIDPFHQVGDAPPLYKLRFMPPLDKFTLSNYMVPNLKDVPVLGAFKLRETSSMDFLLQLKLSESTANSFEYFEVKIPFFDREVQNANLRPSWGITSVSPDRHTIIWNLGNKISSKTSEVSLNGTVLFFDGKNQVEYGLPANQPKSNSDYYAIVNFCTKAYLPSDCHIDSKSVHISPPAKFKFQLEKELVACNYKIWNSNSSAPVAVPISDDCLHHR